MRKLKKAILLMIIFSSFCSLFGCKKAAVHTVGDIQSISVSCGHMDYSHSYSFYIRKVENEWLFDADFALNTENPHAELENCPIADEDVKELFDIVRKRELIKKLQSYKKPKIKAKALDETTYYTSILFSDSEKAAAPALVSKDLEDCFFRLAKKYAGTIPNSIKTITEEE